jgi:hypothetical protein
VVFEDLHWIDAETQALPRAAKGRELIEDQAEGGLHTLVQVLFDPAIGGMHIPDRQRQAQLAAPGFGQEPLIRPLVE